MTEEVTFDEKKEINELTNQLAISKRIGFFLGAGISASIGLPDISELTGLAQLSTYEVDSSG